MAEPRKRTCPVCDNVVAPFDRHCESCGHDMWKDKEKRYVGEEPKAVARQVSDSDRLRYIAAGVGILATIVSLGFWWGVVLVTFYVLGAEDERGSFGATTRTYQDLTFPQVMTALAFAAILTGVTWAVANRMAE